MMLRSMSIRNRRRPRYGAQICAVGSALLLLLSVSLLHTRLSSSLHHRRRHPHLDYTDDSSSTAYFGLDSGDISGVGFFDKIDERDTFEDQNDTTGSLNDREDSSEGENEIKSKGLASSSSGYYMDHVTGSIRRSLNKRRIEEWDYDSSSFSLGSSVENPSKGAFGSDDVAIDEDVRRKVNEVNGIEDALLLKIGNRVSPLREGWGNWFDKKSEFLRRDKMFKSNLEVLNPMHNPLLQDPDGVGVTSLTRGDKALQKLLLDEFKRMPFLATKPLSVSENNAASDSEGRNHNKRAERRTLDENAGTGFNNRGGDVNSKAVDGVITKTSESSGGSILKKVNDPKANEQVIVNTEINSSDMGVDDGKLREKRGMENVESSYKQRKSAKSSGGLYADGRRWGFFPGLHPHLSFSDFLDSLFRRGKCDMRVFMVWNSPPWAYSVRHQRGIESLLSNHRDACIVVLSETMELDFFKDIFVKDGYKVAVAMPNLDELLKDTPAHVFASVWFQWRKTQFYPTHYSELVRLAALYKYGGLYLDSDIIVLNPLSSLNNTLGREDIPGGSSLNGAVMAFSKRSNFLMECLKEFYRTYDDTRLRWNGSDLLTRVATKLSRKENISMRKLKLKVQQSDVFFPISSLDITSYFIEPTTASEEERRDALFKEIKSKSLTFHFWNSLTNSLIPEQGSLVARLLDCNCIHCYDVL